MKKLLLFVLFLALCSQLALAGQMARQPAQLPHRFGLPLQQKMAPPSVQLGGAKSVDSVWFTSNGAPTHASPQGAYVTWAATCLAVDTIFWEIWLDVNKNGQFDSTGADKLLFSCNYSAIVE
ncbi:MAG: hypothetical protein QME74_10750 [Candidatus Edwardsbacteria bacterium]|nr:hypothetical protein [Candidatus Edwardsbacteria bacterium]